MFKKLAQEKKVGKLVSFICCTHVFVSIVKYLYYNKYFFELIENVAIDLLGLVLLLLAYVYTKQNKLKDCFHTGIKTYFSREQILLTVIFFCLLVSCVRSQVFVDANSMRINSLYIKDLFICSFILFPAGIQFAKHGVGKVVRTCMEISLLLLSICMAWIIGIVFQNKVLYNYQGGGIGMLECNGTLQLKINCHPNTVGAYAAFLFLTCIWMLVKSKGLKKVLYVIESAIHFVILALSNSRGAFFAMMCTVVIIVMVVSCYVIKKYPLLIKLLIGSIAGVGVAALLYFGRSSIFSAYESVRVVRQVNDVEVDEVIRDINVTSLSGREAIWINSIKVMFDGPGNFFMGVTPARIPKLLQDRLGWEFGVYTHNQILEVATDTGVPAAVAFVVFLCLLALACLKQGLAPSNDEEWKDKLVILLIFYLIVSNVMEATLLFYGYFSGCMFMVLSGWVFGREKNIGKD